MSSQPSSRFMNPYLAGLGLGLVLLLTFVLMGRGLGASGAATRIASYTLHKVDAAIHGGTAAEGETVVRRNEYMSKYVPIERDAYDDFLVYMFLGVLIGGFISGAAGRRLSFEVLRGPKASIKVRLALALFGGVVAAFGARLARGCTSGQALTGGATLALGSWAFMFAVFAGGYALAYFLRKEWL